MKRLQHSTVFKIAGALVFITMAFLFNNCKGKSDGAIELQSLSASGATSGTKTGLCEDDLRNLYARGWHNFLKTNCREYA